MELKLLSEVDLREAIGPINRAVTGHYLPSVRTASQLRERAAMGILDLKLSRCAFIGQNLVGACLVERVEDMAHLDAIGVDPLAQQRGVGHAMLEAACVAAEAAGVKRFHAEAPESDSPSLATLKSAGFTKTRELSRYELRGVPADHATPEEVTAGSEVPKTRGQIFARQVDLREALDFISRQRREDIDPPFIHHPLVLLRQAGKLTAMLLFHLESEDPVRGAAIFDRERHQLLALSGTDTTPLLTLLMRRHGITHIAAVPEGDPVTEVLIAAGMERTAVRSELMRTLG